MGRGDHPKIFLLLVLLLEHSFMLKSYRVGWRRRRLYTLWRILLSAPVPIGIWVRGLGLGLDNLEIYIFFNN